MPAALAAPAFYVGATAVSYGALLQAALAIGSVAYSRQQSKKAKRALKRLGDLSAEAQERKLTALDPIAPRRLVYGETEVGGTIIFRHTNGTNNQYRHLVIIMADHEVTSFTNLKLDNEVVTLDGAGQATGKYAGYLQAHFFLGSPSQTANAALLANCPEVWTSDHRLRGCAGVYIRLAYNPDLFPNSMPNITALCRGKKLFDPRSALTTWSNNAALVLLDYMTDTKLGMGFDYSSRINEAEIIASANNCDESVELDDGSFEPRYTINGTVSADTVHQDVLDDMVEAMAGKQIDPSGIISIISGYYRTPTTTFTVNDMCGGYNVQAKLPRSENFNSVRGTFISPENFWQASDFPPVTNSTYETQDGGRQIVRDVQLPFTTSSATCQRLAKIILEKARQPITITFPGKLTCLRAQVGDVIGLTIEGPGWEDKPFEVVNIETSVDAENGIQLNFTCRETASTVFDWNDGEETVVDAAPNTNLPSPFAIAAPTDLVVQADNDTRIEVLSGVFVTRIEVSWTAPLDEFVQRAGVIEMEWKLFGTDDWIPTIPVRGDVEITYIENPIEAQSYVVRIRSKNRLGVTSPWLYSDPTTSTGDSTPPDEPEDFTATGGVGGIYLAWENPADSDFDHIEIYEYTANTPDPSGGTTATFSTDSPDDDTYFRDGLAPSTTRYYWIRAVDTSGNKSDWIGPMGATTVTALTATASPTYCYAAGATGYQETSPSTCTPANGVPTYSYLWEYVSIGGSTASLTPAAPTTATTGFYITMTGAEGEFYEDIWRCKVTDSSGAVAYSNEVTARIETTLGGG